MKKAFTLVEMLIVVAILAILMSMVFRLSQISWTDSRRTSTVVRLQKIENCLSGYYAAFGSYPPVKLMGTRDIYCAVDENGDQDYSKNGESGSLNWNQVEAACRAQPFGCEYPGDSRDNQAIKEWVEELCNRSNNSDDYPAYASSDYKTIYASLNRDNPGPDAGNFTAKDKANSSWKAIKLFKFGVMSFLLPRYLFMMGGDRQFFGKTGTDGDGFAQWSDNNDMACNPLTGKKFDEEGEGQNGNGWEDVRSYAQYDATGDKNRQDLAKVVNIPSQAVCARWMPNLAGICGTLRSLSLFGITITDDDHSGLPLPDDWAPNPGAHYPGSGQHTGTPYKNATVTIYDGWDNEFYYYSPAPYQTYTVWSAGSNRKTFPPWMSVDELDNDADKKTAREWMADDVVQMSN